MTQPDKPDLILSDLLRESPARTVIINVADIHPSSITLLEALDIVDVSGIQAGDFERLMEKGTLKQKAQLLYAMAWVVAKRSEPDLTYAEVCTYKLEVKGDKPDDEAERRKARAIMGVATLAKVSPEEAKKMTLNEVSAVVEIHKPRTVRRTASRRRRAS